MNLIFKEIYDIPLKAMIITRSHPDIPKNIKWLFIFIFMHGIYTVFFLLFIYNMIYADNLAIACKNGTFAVVYTTATFQYIVIIWKEPMLRSAFKTVESDYDNVKNLTIQSQEIVMKYAKYTKLVSKLWFWMLISGVSVFPVKTTSLHIYYYCVGNFRRVQIFNLKYPMLSEESTDEIHIFIILYILLLYDCIYCGFVFASFAPLGPNLMLHACGQLEILTKRIDMVFSADDVLLELKSIAIELQRIFSYVEKLQEIFRVAYELILKLVVIALPITGYAIMEGFGDGDFGLEFYVYIFGSIAIASSTCYFSELLLEKGEMFRMAVYTCGWERTYDRRTHRMILLLLQHASRPTAIRTLFRALCLEALTDVYHQAYAIFNLMNAMLK